MSKLPLVEKVLEYIKENNTLLCMPGHKGGKGFLKTPIGKELYKNIIKMDITEVDGLDNLHNAEGVIKESQECLSKLYKSRKSYFLINGSTSGNITMIFSSFNEKDKIIVERNCHKSIFNGIILRKLQPIFIENKINKKYDAPLSIDEEHFLRVLKENSDAKGIVITYPNYYGICCNLEYIIREAKKRNMKVLIDGAHGAHFGICEELPKNPIELGADMVVMSSHKTLPSFTQTAYLHVGKNMDTTKVEFYLKMFSSTSPSYMLMCSMDYARFYMQEYGKEDYNKLIILMNEYKDKINNVNGFHVLGKEDIDSGEEIDPTRYVINLQKGYSAYKFSNYLKKNGIQAEMNDTQNVILIFSPFNEIEDFNKLYETIKKCNIENLKEKYYNILNYNIPEKKLNPFEVLNEKVKYIELEKAFGKICAENIVPYPPGVPLVVMGEVLNESIIDIIKYYLKNKKDVMGIKKSENNLKRIQWKIKIVDK